MLGEIQEVVKTGIWVGDCFIYTSSVNRLNYYVGGEIVTIAHLDRYRQTNKQTSNPILPLPVGFSPFQSDSPNFKVHISLQSARAVSCQWTYFEPDP